jgi:glycosyltransferase involved in cell wall biosynthesis
LQVVICGRDDQGYGPPPSDGSSWREQMLIELGPRLDLQRVHVVGLLPHDQLLELFRLSWVHVYASEPWVLSWSVLEAMACGVALVATDTPAIRDVVTSGRDGVLVPRRDPEALASAITALLHAPHCTAPLRSAARRRILDGFDQRQCSRQRLKLLEAVVAGRRP